MKSAAALLGMILFAAPALAQPAKPSPPIDSAFGAYQRGHFLTALKEAQALAGKNDPQALTLIAELYANGLGVGRDDVKAAHDWLKMRYPDRRIDVVGYSMGAAAAVRAARTYGLFDRMVLDSCFARL